MTIFIDGHSFGYELQRVTQMFFPGERVIVAEGAPPEDFHGNYLHTRYGSDETVCITIRMPVSAAARTLDHQLDAFHADKPVKTMIRDAAPPEQAEHRMGVLIYQTLSHLTGIYPPWGVLTGIRPVKLFLGRMEQGVDETALRMHFLEDCMLDESRFLLALETARVEQPLLMRSSPADFSLYVSIPFCPTRCAYCSFVSHSVEKAANLIPVYLEYLCEELKETAVLTRSLGLRLRTVYFGGGTPTSISAMQLKRLMDTVSTSFDLSDMWEYTVEAGRPDTIDAEKLAVIRAGGAGRVSINPQTLSNRVLEAIGRRHSAEDVLSAYQLARESGFAAINMDLIAGLPTDTPAGFRETVDQVLALMPENITVHTLTVKRGAALHFEQAASELQIAREMVDYARVAVTSAGYRPYYLYRQNGTLAALENVGYSLRGSEGLYNTFIMDERHSIIAVGAGGSTKLCQRGKIKRIFNYKYPYEYIKGFHEVLQRKKTIATFYKENAGDGL